MTASNDTICAPATAPGGALAIIRVSGPRAITIADSIFFGRKRLCEVKSHTAHFGTIQQVQDAAIIDEAVATVFRAPHSYTGEDSVEFSCHGSRFVVAETLRLLCQKGCRMAEPGEFTRRAFLGGRLDLSQAEAVADLIVAETGGQHRVALAQLRGGISSRLAQLRDKLLHLTSLLELELDFSDHEELEFADREQLLDVARQAEEHINRLASSFQQGQAIRQGIPVAIVGKTNVGKSTLLNALLADDRAIVSDIHGTTRDTIEETFTIRDQQFRLIDTAGLRDTTDEVEQIGINRTLQKMHEAAIVIHLADDASDFDSLPPLPSALIVKVLNKIDLQGNAPKSEKQGFLAISAKFGSGIPTLAAHIYDLGQKLTASASDIIITNARHHEALLNASAALRRSIKAMQSGLSGDLVAEDLRQCIDHCNTILGTSITPQDTLTTIFSKFCIGK